MYLPLVASDHDALAGLELATGLLGLRSMIDTANRSLTDAAGLKQFRLDVEPQLPSGARLLTRIHGVSPMVSNTLSYNWPRPACASSAIF